MENNKKCEIIPPDPTWKSKDGEILINKMEDYHLEKAHKSVEYRIKALKKEAKELLKKLNTLEEVKANLEDEIGYRNCRKDPSNVAIVQLKEKIEG